MKAPTLWLCCAHCPGDCPGRHEDPCDLIGCQLEQHEVPC